MSLSVELQVSRKPRMRTHRRGMTPYRGQHDLDRGPAPHLGMKIMRERQLVQITDARRIMAFALVVFRAEEAINPIRECLEFVETLQARNAQCLTLVEPGPFIDLGQNVVQCGLFVV